MTRGIASGIKDLSAAANAAVSVNPVNINMMIKTRK